jgi:dihydroneopterin aldolase
MTPPNIKRVTDIVSIRELRVAAVIGVFDWEREIQQELTFDIDLPADVARAARTDDLKDTLDYSKIADTVKAVVTEGKFQLIETAAERVAERLLADFALDWVKLKLAKPIVTEGYIAIISIERPART